MRALLFLVHGGELRFEKAGRGEEARQLELREAKPLIGVQLARLFEAAPTISSSGVKAEGDATHPVAGMPDGMTSNFIVVVDFRMGSVRQFETELKNLGRVFRVNSSTWLLQSDRSANSIKMTVAPHIGVEDPLLIVDCGRNRMAWHNMGVFEASSIRDLWKLPHERN